MKKENRIVTVKRILGYVKDYKLQSFFVLLFSVLSVISSLYIPVLIGNAIDLIIGKENVDFSKITHILLKVAVLVIIGAVSQWIMNVSSNKITFSVIRDMRHSAFTKLNKLPVEYLDNHPSGEIVSMIIADIDQFADGLLMGFSQFFTGIMTIAGTLIFMLSINVYLALVVVVITPLSIFVARFIAKKTYNMFNLQSQSRAEQTAFVNEVVSNAKIVKTLNNQKENMKNFDEMNEKLSKYSLKAIFYSSITNPATRFVNGVVYAFVALIGALLCISTGTVSFSVGMLSAFLSYANQYTKPFNEISSVITELQNALACAQRVFDLLDEKEMQDDFDKTLDNVSGKTEFENVSFSYDKNKSLIEDFSLKVKSGMRVAVVGPTGCGKTTLINLLMRFYEVDKGNILLDDLSIYDISKKNLRSNFGMVLQDTWLKNATVKDNIKMSNPNATDEEVIEAAKSAHAHSFIKRLPHGYDTMLGEDGSNLSQGQKQLLCIARIMLKLPSVLILDEATSSIDTRTELQVQNAFAKLMQGRTSFVVAHRLSTAKEADLILVMKDGKIIETGNHTELLNKKGFYFELYNSQFAE